MYQWLQVVPIAAVFGVWNIPCQTPTLKAAGSNPVGRTKRIPRAATALGIFILSSTHWQQVKAVMINAMAIQYAGVTG